MKLGHDPVKWMRKKAKQGARSYPIGTLAFHGPDAARASKLVASIVPGPEQEPAAMRKWFDDAHDIRGDAGVLAEAAEFLREHGAHSVVIPERIIGCPHEEGIDYPLDEPCPQCPYWAHRNRWTGEVER